MSKPLSYSAYSKYHQCPKSYDLHYNEKLRPEYVSSALVFGGAFDAGINALLEGKDPAEVFTYEAFKRLQKEKVRWSKYDFDAELLIEDDFKDILTHAKEQGYSGDDVVGLVERLMEKDEISDAQRSVLDLACVSSLLAVASLMFEAYRQRILPLFEGVHSIQRKVGSGFLDIEATLKGIGKTVLDHKTSVIPYDNDAVEVSPQLALYASQSECTHAGFVVFDKRIQKNRVKTCTVCNHESTGRARTCDNEINGKRCGGEWSEVIHPVAKVDLIVSPINKETLTLTVDAINETQKAVEAGCFPRNLNTCKDIFRKPCPYINYCWKGDETGLKRLPKKGDK